MCSGDAHLQADKRVTIERGEIDEQVQNDPSNEKAGANDSGAFTSAI